MPTTISPRSSNCSFVDEQVRWQRRHVSTVLKVLPVTCTLVSSDAFVIPLKRFDLAKERLRVDTTSSTSPSWRNDSPPTSSPVVRRDTRSCSAKVTRSPRFATAHGCEVLRSDATDLNDAVQRAYGALESRFERLIIVHGDLRHPEGLGAFEPDDDITIVTDHHGHGHQRDGVADRTGLPLRLRRRTRRHSTDARPSDSAVASPWSPTAPGALTWTSRTIWRR